MGEALGQTPGRFLAAEVEQKLGGGGEEHVGPGEHRGMGDVLRDHGFPQALRRDQDHVPRVGEEVEAQGGFDGRAVDALGPGPVELAHGGEPAEAAAGEAPLEAAPGALVLFPLDEMLEELGRTPAALSGQGHHIIQMGGGVAQAERGELIRQWSHRASPPGVGVARAGCRRP